MANKIILDGFKKRVECSSNAQVNELLPILWAYRATNKMTTWATPFLLAYRDEAVVPFQITRLSQKVSIQAWEKQRRYELQQGDLVLKKIEPLTEKGHVKLKVF